MTGARPGTLTQGWLASYAADARRHDELLDANGEVRAHWRPLIEAITAQDPRLTARRAVDLTRRLVVENGVTYNVYADPQGADRPWALDPLPLVMDSREWSAIEAGLAQRARVLDALLADLYGPQRLIAEGLVPAELVFGHPNFLWPCQGIVPPGGRWLTLYAADLARAPDGQWWVLADRTQTPSGAGYALENREIIAQVLPAPLRGVRRIGGFFGELRDCLLGSAAADATPLAVILTPGPFNETYFEHAYLARQLGLVLAEGSDLTVRDDTVYLKTLAGLQRVHSILRRLDDDYCDPVELRSDSALGVAGLLRAVRAGRVTLANALGTGVLESAALIGFLPKIAQRLLGETLLLPAVATWWCGEAPALEYVLANLDSLVIKPTYPNQRFEPVFGRSLPRDERMKLIQRLCDRPYAYVAQEHVGLSQAPVWRSHGSLGFTAKAISIRTYTVATPGGRHTMPGGLARVATDAAVDVVSTQRGGGSKDVWVQSDPSVPERIEVSAGVPGLLVRQQQIPSRLVENLYWFGRYLARCEDKARLLRGTIAARIDEPVWRAALAFSREIGAVAAGADPVTSLRDDRNPQGIVADVRRLSWCASQVRARLSTGYWRAVVDMQRRLQDALTARQEPRAVLDRLLLSLAALAGFALDDMTQDAGWRLLRVGRRIERLQFVCGLLAHHLASDSALNGEQVEWLLDAYDSIRVYRSRYVASPRLGPMLDLLVRDAEHPRAIAFLHNAIAEDVAALAQLWSGVPEDLVAEQRLTLTAAELLDLECDSAAGEQARQTLAVRLRSVAAGAGDLSDRLSLRHFSHIGFDSHALVI